MIALQDIRLSFGGQTVFDGISWRIPERARVGLVGDNGTGKTTLLRLILGDVEPDSGSVATPNRKNRTVGYLPQDLVALEDVPLLVFLKGKSGVLALEETIARLEGAMAALPEGSPEREASLRDYEEALSRYHLLDGYRFEAKARQVLRGFGFREADGDKSCAAFSGGWKMRILLAVILLARPDVMLLDEPTNHLDTESMEWLESYLRQYEGTLVTVSHDRVFLDKIVRQIAELAGGRLTPYSGNYSSYLAEKIRRQETQEKALARQEAEERRTQAFIDRFRYKATKARQVQSRIRMLERKEAAAVERNGRQVSFQFPEAPRSGKDVLVARGVAKRYGDQVVLRPLDLAVHRGERVALVGVNGAGKSTLSRLLAGVEAPTGGEVRVGMHVRIGFFSQESAENLDYGHSVWEEVNRAGGRASDQERRNLLGSFLFSGEAIHKPVRVLSGGEKSRLALCKLLLAETNCLILDEPTNHLDRKTIDMFQDALLAYGGTIVIVSHDRHFLDLLVHRVLEVRDGGIVPYAGNYSYFVEKRNRDRLSLQETPDGAQEGLPAREAGGIREGQGKNQRRRDAEERNRRYQARQVLKKKISFLEEAIHRLEDAKDRHEQALVRPETYRDGERARAFKRELDAAEEELARHYREWETLVAQLASAEADP